MRAKKLFSRVIRVFFLAVGRVSPSHALPQKKLQLDDFFVHAFTAKKLHNLTICFVARPHELGLGTHNPRFVAWPLELGLGTLNPLACKKKGTCKKLHKVVAGSDTDSNANVSTLGLNPPSDDYCCYIHGGASEELALP